MEDCFTPQTLPKRTYDRCRISEILSKIMNIVDSNDGICLANWFGGLLATTVQNQKIPEYYPEMFTQSWYT